MKIKELDQIVSDMEYVTDAITKLEYSKYNTLEKPRKELHRKIALPMMGEALNDVKKEIEHLKAVYDKDDDIPKIVVDELELEQLTTISAMYKMLMEGVNDKLGI